MAIHAFNCILDPRLVTLGVKTCFVIVVHGRVKNSYPYDSTAARRQAEIPSAKEDGKHS